MIMLVTAHTNPRYWDGYYKEFIDHILVGPQNDALAGELSGGRLSRGDDDGRTCGLGRAGFRPPPLTGNIHY